MHLVTLGEMPEEKFNPEAEAVVWECFKRDMVRSFDYFVEEGYDEEDIDRIIFEMEPISEVGLSSALPIMELHQHNGYFDEVLEEWGKETLGDKIEKKRKAYDKASQKASKKQTRDWINSSNKRRVKKIFGRASKMDNIKTGVEDKAIKIGGKWVANSAIRRKRIEKGKGSIIDKAKTGAENLVGKTGLAVSKVRPSTYAGVQAAAITAGAGYLGYKLYKKLKEKFSKEKDPKKKAALKVKMAKAKAKKK